MKDLTIEQTPPTYTKLMSGQLRIKQEQNKDIFKQGELKSFITHALFLKLLQFVFWENKGETQQRERHGIHKTRVTTRNNGERKT